MGVTRNGTIERNIVKELVGKKSWADAPVKIGNDRMLFHNEPYKKHYLLSTNDHGITAKAIY